MNRVRKSYECGESCAHGEAVCLPDTDLPRIVVVGGGFAGLTLVGGLKSADAQIVLLDRNNFHQFQPLLYQVAASGLEPDSIVFPYRKQIAGSKNTIFRMLEVSSIDPVNKEVVTGKGRIRYDVLVLASGTRTNYFGLDQVRQFGCGLKEIRDSINIRHRVLANLEEAALTCSPETQDALTNFVIVGGGPAGVELAGALAEFKQYILPRDYPEYAAEIMHIYLVEAGDRLLPAMSSKASRRSRSFLEKMGVEVILGETVDDYDGKRMSTRQGRQIHARNLVWAAGVKGQFPGGLDQPGVVTRGNRLAVNGQLRLEAFDNIYAMGDVAAVEDPERVHGHPQVAQVAIQQGRYLARELPRILAGEAAPPFRYHDKGSLATIGRGRAVADIGSLRSTGFAAWILWSVVHILSIAGFKNKLMVSLSWLLDYFSYDKSSRLIITSKDI